MITIQPISAGYPAGSGYPAMTGYPAIKTNFFSEAFRYVENKSEIAITNVSKFGWYLRFIEKNYMTTIQPDIRQKKLAGYLAKSWSGTTLKEITIFLD